MMTQAAKILVVDDEASIRFFLCDVLERDGRIVTAVDSGETALQYAQAESFDLALIDLRLPGMDGMQLLKNLRRISPDTSIIILTAHASMETAIEALRQGAHDYLFKPCKTVELRESVASGLMKRQRDMRQRQLLAQLERDLSSNLEEIRATVTNRTEAPVALEQEEANDARFIKRNTLFVDLTRHVITLDDTLLELSPTEFNLLAYLASEAPRVISPKELVREVQGYENTPWEARDLARYHIYRIRQKVSKATGRDNLIRTVRGVGYTLNE
jgi:two-component system, OmpR family, response regulator